MSDCYVRLIPPSPVTDASLIASNVPESDYPVYSASATYAADAYVIVTTGVHRIYQNNSGASQTGVYPPTNPTVWRDVAATNRWRMFDVYSSTITSNPDSIIVELTTTSSSNTLALLALQATHVIVKVTHPTDGIVLNKTYDMLNVGVIDGLYDWLFVDRETKTQLLELALPPYRGLTVRVEIHAAGGVAQCGTLILGRQYVLGKLNWGYSWGLVDYSRKETNEDGIITIKERGFSSQPEFSLSVDLHDFDAVARLAAKYRATPAVWIAGSEQEVMTVFGFYKDFRLVVPHSAWAECSLQIEGLI